MHKMAMKNYSDHFKNPTSTQKFRNLVIQPDKQKLQLWIYFLWRKTEVYSRTTISEQLL